MIFLKNKVKSKKSVSIIHTNIISYPIPDGLPDSSACIVGDTPRHLDLESRAHLVEFLEDLRRSFNTERRIDHDFDVVL